MMLRRHTASVFALLALPSPLAQGQASPSPPPDNAVILYDPGPEITCIADVTATDCTPPSPLPLLPLHQQIYLHVPKSPLLTRYVLHWGAEGPSSASFSI